MVKLFTKDLLDWDACAGSSRLRVHFFGVIQTRITEPCSLGSGSNRGTEESLARVGSSALSWSNWLIQTITKGCILKPSLNRKCLAVWRPNFLMFYWVATWYQTSLNFDLPSTRKKKFYNVWSNVSCLSNFIKHDQGVQTGKCFVSVWSPNIPVWRGLKNQIWHPSPSFSTHAS